MNTLREKKYLKPLFSIRDLLMSTFGLFTLKAFLKRKLFLSRLAKEDKARKKQITKEIYAMSNNLFVHNVNNDDIIVSLTSYGKRVTDVLPYALYSLINQTVRPKKIVVFLDWDNWDDNKLPKILLKLKEIGVEFQYCEDIRSYKKLIPSLKLYPNNPIITTDDDFYYNENFIKWMTEAYDKSDKKTVLGQCGCMPIKNNGKYIDYSLWKDGPYNVKNDKISFIGCGGCCYPPHLFDDEILKKEIFMNLCPTADDIWFWAMEERQNIKRAYISPAGNGLNVYVNRIEEYWESIDDTLMSINVKGGMNNSQFRAVVDYYKLES